MCSSFTAIAVGSAPALKNKAVIAIATAHKKSTAAVALKYIVQSGHSFVTASGLTVFDKEDLALFDWELSPADMTTLDKQSDYHL